MSLLDVRDRVPTKALPNEAIRYGIYDEQGKLLRNEYIKREDEPIENGTAINKVLFNDLTQKVIGYNVLSDFPQENVAVSYSSYSRTGEKVFNDFNTGYTKIVKLNNGNVFVAYQNVGIKGNPTASSPRYGTFKILDRDGNIVKDETVFNESVTYYIYAILLQNGNVFIAFRDDVNASKGAFVIYDQDGNLVKEKTVLETGSAQYVSCVQTTNGNVFIVYQDNINSYYGTYVICNQDGDIIKKETVFKAGNTIYPSATALNNGNVFIAFVDDRGYGQFIILNSDGEIQKEATDFNLFSTTIVEAKTLKNGNVFLTYTDANNSNYGTYAIFDEDGNRVYYGTTFASVTLTFKTTVVLEDGKVLIAYTDKTGNSYPSFVIIKETGGTYQSATRLVSGGMTSDISGVAFENNDVLLACGDTGSWVGEIIKLIPAKSYRKDYIIDGLSLPEKGEKLNLWNTNKMFSDKYIINGGKVSYASTSDIGMTGLKNGNIFIGYKDAYQGDARFAIYTKDGKTVKPETVYATGSTYYNVPLTLPNGNVFLIFVEGNNSKSEGTVIVFDQEGNVVKDRKIIVASGMAYISAVLLDDGNIFIAYTQSGSGKIMIVDQEANIIKSAVTFTTSTTTDISATKMKNGNIFIAYKRYYSSNDYRGFHCIFDQQGNFVKNDTELYSKQTNKIQATALNNGNVFISFIESSTYNLTFFIVDHNGTEVKSVTSVVRCSNAEKTATLLGNGNVMLTCADSSTSNGLLYVYDEFGNKREGVITFDTDKLSAQASVTLPDGDGVLAFDSGSSSTAYRGKFIVCSKELGTNLASNFINGIKVDTLINKGEFYEAIYDGEKYIAKEVRV